MTGGKKICSARLAWKDNIKVYYKRVGCNVVEWIIFRLGIGPSDGLF
jgi:hypothetical protein